VPLRALSHAGGDLNVTMHVRGELTDAQGVDWHLRTVWSREDPWAAIS
jgi:hypothetical protein